jgi:hypothetical protein
MKSLLFSAPMMRANLADTKTETRRMPKKSGKHRFAVGELGYAQEAWFVDKSLNDWSPTELPTGCHVFYAADNLLDLPASFGRVRASTHLPERFTRFKFRVLECEFQHLHDITPDQARAEGHPRGPNHYSQAVHDEAALDWYKDLWEDINGTGSWASNPLIECIRYERIPL